MITNIKEIKKELEQKGIRPSYHRLKVLEYLRAHKTHPTVEMIYEDLFKSAPSLSKTTIYNVLSLFVKNGLASQLNIAGHEACFDIIEDRHSHFMCKKCNKIIDLLKEKVTCAHKQEIDGHKVDDVHLYFKGTCKKCLRSKK